MQVVYHVNTQFHLIDEKLFQKALSELASQESYYLDGPTDDNTVEENIGLLVHNLDVLALVRHNTIGWNDIGLERIEKPPAKVDKQRPTI